MAPCKLIVHHPDTRHTERGYILDVILSDFLGLEYESHADALADAVITTAGDMERKHLVLRDILLQVPDAEWLSHESLPRRPLREWRVSADLPEARVISPEIPIIYGSLLPSGSFYEQTEGEIALGLDTLGSAFFMLTRYEEVVSQEKDKHDRFPAAASLAYREGFLGRPIIDEYVEVLWSCMQRLWPRLKRREREYRLVLTHDVDQPLAVLGGLVQSLRSAAGDLVRRRDVDLAWRRLVAYLDSCFGVYDIDPYNTFDFIMNIAERNDLVDAFYFIADHTGDGHIDGHYSIEMPWVRQLMRKISVRGHEIGLHGSYCSYGNAAQVQREAARLFAVAAQEGIRQERWGNRQHYLRWTTTATWRGLDQAGISYDTSLSYASQAGFRCGTCHEYQAYDLDNRRPLSLRERPLIAMDTSLIDRAYMCLSLDGAYETVTRLSGRCRVVGGDLTFLCHNSTLASEEARQFYARVIESCV